MRDTKIDIARGICMVSILLFHTEVYYTGEEIIPYALHVDTSLLTFVFISGYLFTKMPNEAFSLRHKLLSIFRGIVLPYFAFTTIIALPKALFREDVNIIDTLMAVVTGRASWFIAALMVAEVIFAFLVHLTSKSQRQMPWLLVMCILPFLSISIAYNILTDESLHQINYWCWQNACLMLLFLFFGMYGRKMQLFNNLHLTGNKLRKSIFVLFIIILVMVILKYYIIHNDITLTIEPINISSFVLLVIDGLIGSIVVVGICRLFPNIKLLQFTGQHSLIYYFICGAVPMSVSLLLNQIGFPYDGNYWKVLLAFIIVYFSATIITWMIIQIKNILSTIKCG